MYTITTNNVPRFTIDAYEITEREREEFDYIDWPAIERGEDSATFVRYKGELHDIGEFERSRVKGWDGMRPDSFFSALLIRYVDDESVVMGLYTC